jgi:hypothetical protein
MGASDFKSYQDYTDTHVESEEESQPSILKRALEGGSISGDSSGKSLNLEQLELELKSSQIGRYVF